MTLFDRYIAVDWSAANVPRLGKDSIWVGEWGEEARDERGTAPHPSPLPDGERGRGDTLGALPLGSPLPVGERDRVRGRLARSLNLPTRAAAMAHLAQRLRWALEQGERVFVGCDFGFGYPVGTASALTGAADWQAVWALLAELVVDGDDNANNRFAVAEALNGRLGEALFWGHPHQHRYAGLGPRRPTHGYSGIAERRGVEAVARSAQPMFKLAGVGSVGSQSLTGIARLEWLRRDPSLAGQVAVWPFETGFAGPAERPIWLVEMYPSLFPLQHDAPEPRDRAQVEAAAAGFAELDRLGCLAEFLVPPAGTSPAIAALAGREEGWIAGAGQGALLAAGVIP